MVRGTPRVCASAISSKPTSAISVGIWQARSCSAPSAPKAMRSLAVTTAWKSACRSSMQQSNRCPPAFEVEIPRRDQLLVQCDAMRLDARQHMPGSVARPRFAPAGRATKAMRRKPCASIRCNTAWRIAVKAVGLDCGMPGTSRESATIGRGGSGHIAVRSAPGWRCAPGWQPGAARQGWTGSTRLKRETAARYLRQTKQRRLTSSSRAASLTPAMNSRPRTRPMRAVSSPIVRRGTGCLRGAGEMLVAMRLF